MLATRRQMDPHGSRKPSAKPNSTPTSTKSGRVAGRHASRWRSAWRKLVADSHAEACPLQPRGDVGTGVADFLAADCEAVPDRGVGQHAGVVLDGVAHAAYGVGDERVDCLAAQINAVDEGPHDHRWAYVPD